MRWWISEYGFGLIMKTRLRAIIRLLFCNPLLLLKIIFAELRMKLLPAPRGNYRKQINGVAFELNIEDDIHCKKMAFDLYEPLVINAMKNYLFKGSTFLDVGANIGFISAMAAGMVGRSGHVHSFEPSPRDFKKLERFSLMNPDFDIICNQFALGDAEGVADLHVSNFWLGWNTLVAVAMPQEDRKETVQVTVKRLDDYIDEHQDTIGRIGMIKIDVEGVEFSVLKGLQKFFERGNHPPILCEVSPNFFRRLGLRLTSLVDYMEAYGYRTYSLLDLRTEVDIPGLEVSTNVLFRCRP